MKTAVIFAGFFRTFDFIRQSFIDNVVEPLQCDIFFVAPKTMFAMPENEPAEMHHIYAQNAKLIDIGWFDDKLKAYNLIDHDANMYKRIISENNMPDKNIVGQYCWRILSYMHNISLSVSLFKQYVEENHIEYDLVILTRADMKYYRKFDPSVLDMTKLNFALHSMVGDRLGTCEASPPSFNKPFNDQIVAGTQKNILVYHDIYDKVLSYHKNENIAFVSETFFGVHSARNGVDCVPKDFVFYELWRESKF